MLPRGIPVRTDRRPTGNAVNGAPAIRGERRGPGNAAARPAWGENVSQVLPETAPAGWPPPPVGRAGAGVGGVDGGSWAGQLRRSEPFWWCWAVPGPAD